MLDADDLDRRVGAWAATRTDLVAGRRVTAVGGKSLRGGARGGSMPHPLAALDHQAGVVLGQQAVPDKGSEISALRELLAQMDLALLGAVVLPVPDGRAESAWLEAQLPRSPPRSRSTRSSRPVTVTPSSVR